MNTPAGTGVQTLPLADLAFFDQNGATAAALHLTSTSMARGYAEAGSTTGDTAVDYDGESRPNPAGNADVGADEIP